MQLGGLGAPGQRETRTAGWLTELWLPVAQTGVAIVTAIPITLCAQFIAALILYNTLGASNALTQRWLWWQLRLLPPVLVIRHLLTLQWAMGVNVADPNWPPPAVAMPRPNGPLTPGVLLRQALGAWLGKVQPQAVPYQDTHAAQAMPETSTPALQQVAPGHWQREPQHPFADITVAEWHILRRLVQAGQPLSVRALIGGGIPDPRARAVNAILTRGGALTKQGKETRATAEFARWLARNGYMGAPYPAPDEH